MGQGCRSYTSAGGLRSEPPDPGLEIVRPSPGIASVGPTFEDETMESASDRRNRLTLVIRWTARVWAVAAIGVVLLLSVAEGLYPARPAEWIGLALYPGGVCVGMILAWWREGLGGGITVGSLVAFYAVYAATAGTLPRGPWWLVLAVPGFLFLWCWKRSL